MIRFKFHWKSIWRFYHLYRFYSRFLIQSKFVICRSKVHAKVFRIFFSIQSSLLCAWILNTLFENTNQNIALHLNSKNVMSMINQTLFQIDNLRMQTTMKLKLRAIFDRQSLERKNAVRRILMQRVRNSMNMNQLKINQNVHFVNNVFCDNVENLSMHELQINFMTIRRFIFAIEMINFIMIYLIVIELMIILKFHFSILLISTNSFETFTIVKKKIFSDLHVDYKLIWTFDK
jgi:hypothetical protein